MVWTGVEQRGTPWSDGVPGVTQYPIPPSSDFIYRWKATQSGFYVSPDLSNLSVVRRSLPSPEIAQWYHSHYRMQLGDGARAPLVIHPRPDRPSSLERISTDPAVLAALKKAELNPHAFLVSDWSRITTAQCVALVSHS